MKFSLIVCTYMRSESLLRLLHSVKSQDLYPDEILIVDGSLDNETETCLKGSRFDNLVYFRVGEKNRGLTKQRNYGISLVSSKSEIICFLDDDIVLESGYFNNLISTYNIKPDALAVGGYITNEVLWQKEVVPKDKSHFYYDGWQRTEPLRFKMRRYFGLLPDVPPGFMPTFSHGRSISFLPPSNRIYEVEQLMGGVSSYKKEIFKIFKFSTYFEGYGLYEDADFSLRLAKTGKLYINTVAQLGHYHDDSGRPNKFKYGKMVIRNGWYVWRVKYANPSIMAKIKWHATAILLIKIRILNIVTTSNRNEALIESFGRIFGWFSLIFNPPKVNQ